MTSFIEALQGFDFTKASATQNAKINAGDGNNEISVIGDKSTIKAGNGNNVVEVQGDDDSILVGDGNNKITTGGANTKITAGNKKDANSKGNNKIFQVGEKAKITVANGNNTIISYSNKATITGGNGDNVIGSMGNKVKITLGNGNNAIGFWGDNDKINLGNGNNNVKTLDWLIGGPEGEDKKSKAHNSKIKSKMAGHDLSQLQSNKDIMKMAKTVKSTFKTDSKTTKKVTGTSKSTSTSSYVSGGYRYTTTKTTTTTNYLKTYIKSLNVTGVKNPTVQFGNGNNDIGLTVTNKYTAKAKSKSKQGDNNITVIKGGYSYYKSVTQKKTSDSSTTCCTIKTRICDPLIIDFNQDGVVSAAAGKGIDINGDGKANGAAINGDKMLAMSDINNNGQIDGAEVFGDTTVDPFTNQKLNAKNGFEALELLAKSAEKHTGISCMDKDGNVNLSELKRALNTKGIELGFVSNNNNTTLEKLEKVVSINVKNYTENNNGEGDAYHAQQGTYIDENGKTHKVHDVWFN